MHVIFWKLQQTNKQIISRLYALKALLVDSWRFSNLKKSLFVHPYIESLVNLNTWFAYEILSKLARQTTDTSRSRPKNFKTELCSDFNEWRETFLQELGARRGGRPCSASSRSSSGTSSTKTWKHVEIFVFLWSMAAVCILGSPLPVVNSRLFSDS